MKRKVQNIEKDTTGKSPTSENQKTEQNPKKQRTWSEYFQETGANLVEGGLNGLIWFVKNIPDYLFFPLTSLANLFREGVLGFLTRTAKEGGQKILGLLWNFIRAIASPSFITAFVTGTVRSFFVDGVWGTLKLLWDIATLPVKIYDFGKQIFQYLGDTDLAAGLKQIGSGIVDAGSWILSNGKTLITKIVDSARNANVEGIKDSFENLYNQAKTTAGKIGSNIAGILIGYFSKSPDKIGSDFGNTLGSTAGNYAFDAVLSVVTAGAGAALVTAKTTLKPILTFLRRTGKRALDGAKSVWKNLTSLLQSASKGIGSWVGKLSDELGARLQKIVEGVQNFFQGLSQRIQKGKKKGHIKDVDSPELPPELAHKKAIELPVAIADAKAITKMHDHLNAPVTVLLGALDLLKSRFSWINSFRATSKGKPGHFKIEMLASKHTLDEDYTTQLIDTLLNREDIKQTATFQKMRAALQAKYIKNPEVVKGLREGAHGELSPADYVIRVGKSGSQMERLGTALHEFQHLLDFTKDKTLWPLVDPTNPGYNPEVHLYLEFKARMVQREFIYKNLSNAHKLGEASQFGIRGMEFKDSGFYLSRISKDILGDIKDDVPIKKVKKMFHKAITDLGLELKNDLGFLR